MRIVRCALLIVAVSIASNGTSAKSQRPRLAGVPPHATWAGGVDGGDWLEFFLISEENERFRCISYNDFSGALKSMAEYVLVGRANDLVFTSLINDAGYLREDYYNFFDGVEIHLSNEMSLWPDSVIIWPLGRFVGKIEIIDDRGHSKALQYDRSNIVD